MVFIPGVVQYNKASSRDTSNSSLDSLYLSLSFSHLLQEKEYSKQTLKSMIYSFDIHKVKHVSWLEKWKQTLP